MVADIDRSTEFYENVIGIAPSTRDKRHVTFESDGCTFVLEQDHDPSTLSEFGLTPPGQERGDGVVIVLAVDSVSEAHERAVAADADILLKPTEVDWGRKILLIRDPDGYILELSRPL